MIRLEDPQPAGPPTGLVPQVEEIFSPKGLLSKSPNFEYRPQQQQMAVAVARALEEGKNLIVEAGTGVGKSLAYLIPSILFAVARQQEGDHLHPHHQFAGAIDPQGPAHAGPRSARSSSISPCSRAGTIISAPAAWTRSAPAGPPAFHLARRGRSWSALANGPKKPRTAASRISTIEPDPNVWQQVCSERGLCSPRQCGHGVGLRQGRRRGPAFYQQARSRMLAADVLVLNHTLFFTLLGGLGGGTRGRRPVEERFRHL